MTRLSFRCPKCGGSSCGKDAIALWNDFAQDFADPVTMDQNHCTDCGEVGEFDEIELPAIPTRPPLATFLDLSTAHITADVAKAMTDAPETFPVSIKSDENGFFVGTAGYTLVSRSGSVPDCLKVCLEHAVAQGCTHILFDNATALYEGLATYDW